MKNFAFHVRSMIWTLFSPNSARVQSQLWAAGSYSSEGISPIVAYFQNVKVSPF